MTTIVIDTPKLLPIRINTLTPGDTKNNFVYTYTASVDITAQLHSGTQGFTAGQYDGRDVRVGDYIATSSQGRILKISSITNAGPTRIECTLIDEDQVNSAVDPTQFGESAIDADDGILFELREGRPYLFPLPDVLPGGLTNEFAIQILSRFNYVNKEKNVNVEQVDHSFDVGETVRITNTGWVSDIADPSGVVVKTDGDSYSVRLFGVKTALELPGEVGDVYFWDPVDRILTTNSTREGVVKLFQKLDSREALLLSQGEGDGGVSKQYVDQQIANAINGGDVDLSSYVTENELTLALSGLGDHFSGDYNDLINTPTIPTVPTDVSAFTNDAGYLTQHQDLSNYALKTDTFSGDYNDLTNAPTIPNVSNFLTETQIDSKIAASQFDPSGYATEAYVAQAIANVESGGGVDLSGYATTVDLNNAIANINTFSGDYNDLTNAPTLTGLATETWVTSQLANYQPSIDLSDYYTKTQVDALIPTTFSGDYNDLTNKPVIPTAFSGDYNDLTNTPTIPSVAGLASVSYVDQQIANVQSGGSIDLSDYVTEAELATQLANYQPTVDLTGYALLTDIPTPFSGDYNDLTNTPSLFDGDYNNLTNKPALFGGSYNELTDKPNIFSGNYNELYNKPSIPSKTSDLTNDVGFLTNITGQQVQQALGYTPANTTDVFSGDYNSLINKPSIPDVTGLATETYVDDQIAAVVSGGTIDLSGYVTEGELATAIANLGTSNVVNINDLSDVAVGSLPQQANANEHYLLEWNPVNSLWESKDFGNIFATQQYVTETVATIITDGDINLDGYATEQFVEQKIVELGPHFSGDYYDLTNRPMLFSGNYNDLVNIPTRKEYTLTSSGSVLNLVETAADPDQIVASVDFSDLGIGFSGNYEDLFNRPILFSGNYDDLNNKPYIPSIAGLATEEYVDNRWAEPQITGDRYFTHNVEVQGGTTVIKNSTLNSHTAAKRMISLAIQTTDATVTEVRYSDGSAVTFDADTTVMLTATIVAAGDTINDRSAIIHKGILAVDSNNATMVGEAAKEIIDEDAYGWTSNIYTDNSGTRELRITVQGSATETVNWTVFLEAYEVQKT